MPLEQIGAEAVLQGLNNFLSGTDRMASAIDKLGDRLDETSRKSDGINTKSVAIGAALGGIVANAASAAASALVNLAQTGFGALTDFIGDSITAANESAKVQAQLNAVLASTAGAAGMTAESLNAMAESLQAVTTFDDEAINGAQAMLLTFGKIGSDIFPQATEAVLNLGTAMGGDLQGAAIQVGKALQDPVLGVNALRRAGVSFSEQQKDLIKTLVDTGQSAKAQQLILAELEKQFGGSARAAAGTFGGALIQLGNRFENLQEKVGAALEPIGRVIATRLGEALTAAEKKFAELEADGSIARWSAQTAALIDVVITGFVTLAGTVIRTFTIMAQIAMSVGRIIQTALMMISPFTRHSPSLVEQVEVGVDDIISSYQRILEIRKPIGLAEDAIQRLGEAARSPGKKGLDVLKEAADDAKKAIGELEDKIRDAQGRIRDLEGTPITGETAVDDQLFALEQERKRAQLEVINRKQALLGAEQGGASKEQLKPLEDAVDAAERAEDAISLTMDKIRTEAELTFDPMRRQIERIADPIEELPFDTIVEGIRAAHDEIATAEQKLGPAREAYNTLALAVEQYSKRVEESGGGGGGAGGGGGIDLSNLKPPEEFKSPIDAEQWQRDFDAAVASYNTTILPVFADIEAKLLGVNKALDLIAPAVELFAQGWVVQLQIIDAAVDVWQAGIDLAAKGAIRSFENWRDTLKPIFESVIPAALEAMQGWFERTMNTIELFTRPPREGIEKIVKALDALAAVLRIELPNPFTALAATLAEILRLKALVGGGGGPPKAAEPSSDAPKPTGGERDTGLGGGGLTDGEPVVNRQPLSAVTAYRPVALYATGGGGSNGTSIQVGPNIIRNDMDIARLSYETRRYNPASMR